jgi:hypothetical protein
MPPHTSLLPRVLHLMRRRSALREAHDSAPAVRLPTETAPPSVVPTVDAESLDMLEAEARHHRARLDLYRARAYALKPTSATRLRELERTAALAESRVTQARGRASGDRSGPH